MIRHTKKISRSGSALRLILMAGAALWLAQPASADNVDGDAFPDVDDNCVDRPNDDQKNSDFDPYGNACDGDLDNDGDTDDDDLDLLRGEVDLPDALQAADLDGNDVVDGFDEPYFFQYLYGNAPGPEGAESFDPSAVCAKSDYRVCMEACQQTGSFETCYASCNPGGPPFPNPWDETQHPNLLVNGDLAGGGAEPTGWDPFDPINFSVAYQPWVTLSGSHAFQWVGFGGSGKVGSGQCSRSCVAPEPIPVTFGRSYVFSYFSCAAEFPPAGQWVVFDEYDSQGSLLAPTATGPFGAKSPQGDKGMNSQPGVWEETTFIYTPTSPSVAAVRPKLARKKGPGNSDTVFFADEFRFWELDAAGNPTFRSPPAPKRAFDGARVRVDSLGNIEVFENNQWEPFFLLGIYASPVSKRPDYSFYTDLGFNTVMNDRGWANDVGSVGAQVGMRFMLHSGNFWSPATLPTLTQALAFMDQPVDPMDPQSPLRSEALLGFYFDNESWGDCIKDPADPEGKTCLEPIVTVWNLNKPVLQEIRQWDRDQNGGALGLPIYFLNGQGNISRGWANDVINAEGDRRMDIVGSYGASRFLNLDRLENQTAPPVVVGAQAALQGRWLPMVWAGIALGASGVVVHQDEKDDGHPFEAPLLRICGTSPLPDLPARETLLNPMPSQIVRGKSSGARAEILVKKDAWTGCVDPQGGQDYWIKMWLDGQGAEAFFQPGEELVDDVTGADLDASNPVTVDEVIGSYLVKWHVGLEEHVFVDQIPELAQDLDTLEAMLRQDHRPDWSFDCSATFAWLPTASPLFGNSGFVCGARTWNDIPYLIVSNTYDRLDPFGAFNDQYEGAAIDVDISFADLPFAADRVRLYDFATHQWSSTTTPMTSQQLTIRLDEFEVAIIKLEQEGGCGLVGFEILPVLLVVACQKRRRARRAMARE